jgi:hypothetical protein
MKILQAEINTSCVHFEDLWKSQYDNAIQQLEKYKDDYLLSYTRLVSLQAWRCELLEGKITQGAKEFYIEAQNDAILSHILARIGCWRSALQSLRSTIENVYQTIYYKDHPIELMLWENDGHRLSRMELQKYIETHPSTRNLNPNSTGIAILDKQYKTLNNAVHASAKSFRMTQNVDELKICDPDKSKLGKWMKNENDVVQGINILLLAVFSEEMQGMSYMNLKKTISLALTPKQRKMIKRDMKIVLPEP